MSSIYVENTLNEIQSAGGINTQKPVVLSGTSATLAVGGTSTFTGAATFTAAPTFSSGIARPFTTTTADTIAVGVADSSRVYLATKSSATQTFTLPAVAAGLIYTFICGHASGEILVTPTGSVGTVFTTFAAVGVDSDTTIVTLTAGTGFKNTAATNAIGDSITVISDGVGWYGVGITSGIWATQ